MTTLTLWLVIYLAVGYLIDAATAAEEDTPGMTFVMSYLWPLPMLSILSAWVWGETVNAINWVLEQAGYDWKE